MMPTGLPAGRISGPRQVMELGLDCFTGCGWPSITTPRLGRWLAIAGLLANRQLNRRTVNSDERPFVAVAIKREFQESPTRVREEFA